MNKIKRWYDSNVKLNKLVIHLEQSSPEKQKFVAKTIIKISREENLHVEPVTAYVRQLRRRWYDYDETVALAMEYLKIAPYDLQTKISAKILFNMNKIDEFIEQNIYVEQGDPEERSSFF